ncbi:hypothetical protein [Actinomadura sp. 3N407]|uniref:hypothetical protein n=1 Tax=Actinomadura sp. 3N407 TaxID=3457423 RepID=UPI003FCCA155
MASKRGTAAKQNQARQPAKERVAAMRKQQARRERRERIVIFGAVGVITAALIGGGTWAVVSQGGSGEQSALPTAISGSGTSEPPWPLPADPVSVAREAGLTVQPMEGTAKHFHAHLDVPVNGEEVTVPANLGIHPSGNAMSELHTHDERGVLHVEAPTANKRYTLGQVFAEWDVRLTAGAIGGLRADGQNSLRAYVDGEQVTGNPADIELKPHRQIALLYGPADAKADVPAEYDFKPGE